MTRYFYPGPTLISKNVEAALSKGVASSDFEPGFAKFYRQVCAKLRRLVANCPEVVIVAGEGMLGLEMALANVLNNNSNVLVLNNGVFGEGFADLVGAYTSNITMLCFDPLRGIDASQLEGQIDLDAIDVATIVHVDTPTGVCNDIASICAVLKRHNILTIVDSVSSWGGIDFDARDVDLLLGASQKAISAPVGLSFLAVSSRARELICGRELKIPLYLDLAPFLNGTFPYTQPWRLLNALDVAIDEVVDFRLVGRFASAVRRTLVDAKIKLFLDDDFANTVTAFYPPGDYQAADFIALMREAGMVLAPSISPYDNLIRIGHMGNNCNAQAFIELFAVLGDLLNLDLAERFRSYLAQ